MMKGPSFLEQWQRTRHGRGEESSGDIALNTTYTKPMPTVPVRIEDNLQVPSLWKVYSAISINLTVAIFLIIIPFQPVWIHKDGGMTSGLHTAWTFLTTILATIIKMWTTGIMQTIWAHVALKPQPDARAAVLRAKYGRSMLGIGSIRDAIRNPKVIGFLFMMGIMLASISAAITPTNVVVEIDSSANTTASTTAMCFFTTSQPLNKLNWQVGNNEYMYSLAAETVDNVDCPWLYTQAMVKPGLKPANEAAYAVSGVLVANSSMGVPVSIPGGFDEVFGISTTMDKSADKYYSAPQIHMAKACLPRLSRNPVSCKAITGAMTYGPYNEAIYNAVNAGYNNVTYANSEDNNNTSSNMYCMRTPSGCGGCSVWNYQQRLQGNGNFSQHWNTVLGDNSTASKSHACMAEIGTNWLSQLVGEEADSPRNETVVECNIDVDPAIDTSSELTYWNKQFSQDSPVPDSTFPWQVSVAEPIQHCNLSNASAIFRTAESYIAAFMGTYQMIEESSSGVDDFWPTLFQLANSSRSNPNGLQFASSTNPLEDALGISAGASLGAYWGSIIEQATPSIQTRYFVEWVVLGPRQPWAVIFAFPSAACAITVFLLHLQMQKVRRGGYQYLPDVYQR